MTSQTDRASWYTRPWVPSLVLALLLVLSLAASVLLIWTAPAGAPSYQPFLFAWLVSYLPYLAACVLIWKSRSGTGRWQRVEWGLIILGTVLPRVLLLPLPPNLSHDSWRYLWDARVTLHGYSPYVYTPEDPLFAGMRDILFQNSRFRNVPTIYPPAAQAVYLLGGLIAPTNLSVLKGIFMLFDFVTCGTLVLLLKRKGFDPRYVIFYAWCPLPIVEFAMQGHVDVIALTFIILAVFWSQSQFRGARILTGILLALAIMTKFYPLILLVVFLRRRDWVMPLACLVTVVLSYIPFLILGHGQVLGFLSHYVGEQGGNAGPIQVVIDKVAFQFFGQNPQTAIRLEILLDLIVVGTTSLVVWLLWQRQRIKLELAILILIGIVLACSSHVFPWYATVLLPWIIPALSRGSSPSVLQLYARRLALISVWYFPCLSILGYFWASSTDWSNYYLIVYGITTGGLAVAAFLSIYLTSVSVKTSRSLREKKMKILFRPNAQSEERGDMPQPHRYLDEPIK